MKGPTRKAARCVAIATALAATGSAHAIPVFDLPNFIVNIINKHTLLSIDHQLKANTSGTVNYNTTITADIDKINIAIDNNFTWIINQGGDEIIPIPKGVKTALDSILDWKKTKQFTSQFKSADEYAAFPEGGYSNEVAIVGSRARKAANDTLITAVGEEQQAFVDELAALKELRDKTKGAQGQGRQLQIANAMAASQVNQLMKLRSMMMVSEASRAVEAQVSADKDARAIAVGAHLRNGLDKALSQSLVPLPTY